MGCRTQAWAWVQATADSAWADMAVMAVCRRKVCGGAAGAVPQRLLKLALELVDWAPGLAEVHVVDPDRKSVSK